MRRARAALIVMAVAVTPTVVSAQDRPSVGLVAGVAYQESGGRELEGAFVDMEAFALPWLGVAATAARGQTTVTDFGFSQSVTRTFAGLGPRVRYSIRFLSVYGHVLYGTGLESDSFALEDAPAFHRRYGVGLDFSVDDRMMIRIGADADNGGDSFHFQYMAGVGVKF